MKSIVALYEFTHFTQPDKIRNKLVKLQSHYDIKGTLLVAHEGINGTVSVESEQVDGFIQSISYLCNKKSINYKVSHSQQHPFHRYKVKLKKEIVTIGCDVDPIKKVGSYVSPRDWNDLISQDDILLIDTRNDYEYAIGTFKGAINPKTSNFREFPQYVQGNLKEFKRSKIAMFCTGGIRCEKASSYMLSHHFSEVYHLKGGILKYLEEIPLKNSLWQGECFVFDQRVAVSHGLNKGSYDQCHACRWPITQFDKESIYYKEGVSCHRCYSNITSKRKEKFIERQRQIAIAKQQGKQHIGQCII